jgi:hypothetical protein
VIDQQLKVVVEQKLRNELTKICQLLGAVRAATPAVLICTFQCETTRLISSAALRRRGMAMPALKMMSVRLTPKLVASNVIIGRPSFG